MSGSSRVQACDFGLGPGSGFQIRPFTTLCGYVGKNQQMEIERMHPPPTNSKNRWKSFCDVGYANYRLNVFAAGKRISVEILVGLGLHARCPVALKIFAAFSKNGNVQEKYLSSL